jgi:hypothetical protein
MSRCAHNGNEWAIADISEETGASLLPLRRRSHDGVHVKVQFVLDPAAGGV